MDRLTKYEQHCDKLIMNNTLYNLKDDNEKWLFDRIMSIGASEVATVCGFNKYQTPYELWQIKTARRKAPDLSNNTAVRIGRAYESKLLELYAEDNNLDNNDKKVTTAGTVLAKDKPWLSCTPDGIVATTEVIIFQKHILSDGLDANLISNGVEIKTGVNSDDWGTDKVPDNYLAQVQWCMHITGIDTWHLYAELVGFKRELKQWEFHYDADFCKMLEDRVTEFYFNNVIADVPPEAMTNEDILNMIDIFNVDDEIVATDNIVQVYAALKQIKEQYSDLTNQKKDLELQLKKFGAGHKKIVSEYGEKLATISYIKGRETLDKEALSKDVDISKYLKVGKDTMSLRVS